MKKLLLLIVAVFVTGCPSTQQSSPPHGGGILSAPVTAPTYKVYVKGLVCPACAVGLKKYLLKLPFVKTIHVNYKTGMVLIYEVDDRVDHKGIKKYDKPRITKAVKDSGYEVDKFIK